MDATQAVKEGQELLEKRLDKISAECAKVNISFKVFQKNKDQFFLIAGKLEGKNLEIPIYLSKMGMKAEQVPKNEADVIAFLAYIMRDSLEQQQVGIHFFGKKIANLMINLWNVIDQVQEKVGIA